MLTQQQVEAYERDGYLSGIRISDEDAARRYRQLFDELEVQEGRGKCQIGLHDRHFDQRFIWELATLPPILSCVEALMGPNVMMLATHFFCKYGESERFVAWHQDLTYWGLQPPYVITAWYAIDDSDCENGCMRVIPGTHTLEILEHGKSDREGNLLSINQEVHVSEEDEKGAADLILKAGEISIHHGALIHGSLPNRSQRRRCGLTIRYVPPWVKQAGENSTKRPWKAILVRGEDQERHFGERPRPF
ncbi:MAG: phytanoyl-CoA dioxygenase family protein [Candidatus Latescibacteria bacterium]|nr:phytanoyl-CoA dioxygenase family protein [Candidatus Latescibacterota bacterium]